MNIDTSSTLFNRVPHIVFLYWVIKIASTTLGETGADMFSMTYELGYGTTIILFMGLFTLLLWIKLALKRYEPVTYWLTFTATAIAGTAISDYVDRTLGLGYGWGSVLLVTTLVMVLWAWYVHEKSIDVEHITNRISEIYYWLAFLAANTLGTAAGDFLADELGLGFAQSAVMITALLGTVALLHYYTAISGVLLFWLAFVLTRPFGATFGDWLTKSDQQGGMDIGTVGSSLFFALILLFAVRQEMKSEKIR